MAAFFAPHAGAGIHLSLSVAWRLRQRDDLASGRLLRQANLSQVGIGQLSCVAAGNLGWVSLHSR
jgi:hypothetical protein